METVLKETQNLLRCACHNIISDVHVECTCMDASYNYVFMDVVVIESQNLVLVSSELLGNDFWLQLNEVSIYTYIVDNKN